MVFLRLVVKVYPREQIPQPPSTSKISSTIRNLLPENNLKTDSAPTPNLPPGTPVSFLLALSDPEATTLGQLASLIQSKWKKLRPHAEPLEIKKLLDDTRDSVDLDIDLTVADVFVNKARARRDEDDQSGTVRVIQRPAAYAPVRFPSVDQDWDAAVGQVEEQRRERKSAADKQRFSPIEEEGEGDDDEEEEEEGESEEPGSEQEEGSEEDENEEDENEQPNGHADEGESEAEPVQDNDVTMEDSLPETRVLKRKISSEHLEPKKQARLEQLNHVAQENGVTAEEVNVTPLSSPLGARKRDADRAPSFSGLGRRLSFGERPALSNGLGLGITKSPPRKRLFFMADKLQDPIHPEPAPNDARLSPTSLHPSSSAPSLRRGSINQPCSTPAKLQTPADKVRQLQSALRKDSPAERTPERRSVSFAEGEDLVIPTSVPTSVPASKPATRNITKEEQKDAGPGVPSRRLSDTSSGVPPAATPEEEEAEQSEEEEDEEEPREPVNMQTNEFEEKLQAQNPDSKSDYARKLKFASRKWDTMKRNENATRKRDKERYSKVVQELKEMKAEILEIEESMKPPSQRRKAQTPKPNGTPAPRKLSRPEPATSSQSRKSEELWDIEILTPRPNSKKLIPKEPASSQSGKSQEREPEREPRKELWDIDISTPKANGAPLRRSEAKKPSQEKQTPPPPSEELESEEESSSDEQSIALSRPSVVIRSPPKSEESKSPSKPDSAPKPDSETESESDQSESEEEDDEEQKDEEQKTAPTSEQKPTSPKTNSKPESESESEEEETES
ncbi:hypothetical protein BBP40_010417, partial [Aspergillus hancockii]